MFYAIVLEIINSCDLFDRQISLSHYNVIVVADRFFFKQKRELCNLYLTQNLQIDLGKTNCGVYNVFHETK